MPLKRTPAPATHSPATPDGPALPDDHSEPSTSVDKPTITEYNDLVTAHREALCSIRELEANVNSSLTTLVPQEQLHDPKVKPPPEFSRKISEFPNFMAACSLVFTLCPNTYSSHERKVLYVISRLCGMAMSWACTIAENPAHPYRHDYPAFKTPPSNLYSNHNL